MHIVRVSLLIAVMACSHDLWSQTQNEFKKIEASETEYQGLEYGSRVAVYDRAGVVVAPGVSQPHCCSFGRSEGQLIFLRKDSDGEWTRANTYTAEPGYELFTELGNNVAASSNYIFATSRQYDGLANAPIVQIFSIDPENGYVGLSSGSPRSRNLFTDPYGRTATRLPVAYANDYLICGNYGDNDQQIYLFQKDFGGVNNWGQVKTIGNPEGWNPDSEFGYAASISGSFAAVGSPIEGNGKAYIFSKDLGGTDNWGLMKSLVAPDGEADDRFGEEVHISGDIAIVSSINDDDGANNSGAAYIFYRDEGGADNWGFIKKVTAPDAVSDDNFGVTLLLLGDVLVVSAPSHDGSQSNSGATYFFSKDLGGTNNWGFLKKLTGDPEIQDGVFSSGVTGYGDEILIGHPGTSQSGSESGSVTVFRQDEGGNGQWGAGKTLIPTSGLSYNYFGNSIDATEEVLAVSTSNKTLNHSPNVIPSSSSPTGIHIYLKDHPGANEWGLIRTIPFSDYDTYTVSIDNDLLAASHPDYINFAHPDFSTIWVQGMIRIHSRNNGGINNWGLVKQIDETTYGHGEESATYGRVISLNSGFLAVSYADELHKIGKVYTFDANTDWGLNREIAAPDGQSDDYFGFDLQIRENTLAVSSVGDDDKGANSGSVYIYSKDHGGVSNWGFIKKITANDAVPDDSLGYSLSLGNGLLAIGAPGANATPGAVYIYAKDLGGTNNWGFVKKIESPDKTADDEFGIEVKIDETALIVGAGGGKTYLFLRHEGENDSWSYVNPLQSSDFEMADKLGQHIAIANNTIFVSATDDNNHAGTKAGAVYAFYEPPVSPEAKPATQVTANSFVANWEGVEGADYYQIDVSADNFESFLPDYHDKTADNLSLEIQNLDPETQYTYRVRAANSFTSSLSSNIVDVSTHADEPAAQPTGISFSNITTSSLTGSFDPAADHSDGYIVLRRLGSAATGAPADGSVYDTDGSIGDGTVVYVGAGTSFNDASLVPGTVYYYSIFSYNGSGEACNYLADNPATSTVVTICEAPEAIAATGVKQTSFTAVWQEVTGAEKYLLDVSDDDFATLLAAYQGNAVTGLSAEITGLSPGVTYEYRVRASNESGSSSYSNHIAQITVPDTPVPQHVQNPGATSFTATWDAVEGATHYELDVSTNNFDTYVTGYNAKSIPATTTQELVSPLSPSTQYQFRVRAVNAGGTSPSSNIIGAVTASTGGPGTTELTLSTPSFTNSPNTTISVTATGGSGVREVTFFSRGILEETFEQVILTSSTTTYSTTVNAAMLDELGLEFYFTADDASTLSPLETTHGFIYKSFDALSTPSIPFSENLDGTSATYEMFSIPYTTEKEDIASVFRDLGAYDQTQWRIFHYQNGKNREYQDGLNDIESGKGYWFNAREKPDVKPGAGRVVEANQTKPFTTVVVQGWNQIGNPFPFNVEWDAVREASQEAGLSSLWLYENGSYVKKDVLPSWKGAFVFSDHNGTITFPVSARTSSNGRKQGDDILPTLDDQQWILPITLKIRTLRQTAGIGMHPDAKMTKDRFDEISVPRFIDYVQMFTHHPEFFSPQFASDIVPTTDEHTWIFDVESNVTNAQALLTWDNNALTGTGSSIMLIDQHAGKWVDMKTTGTYTFQYRSKRQFRILYSKSGEVKAGTTMLGDAYPNPFLNELIIPLLIGKKGYYSIEVFDGMGRKIRTLGQEFQETGIQYIHWDGKLLSGEPTSPGLLFFRLTGDPHHQARRLIKK